MDLKFSKVTRKGPVTIVTLNRPEVMNALHSDAHFELDEVFNDFAADHEQWVGDRHRRRRAGVLGRQRPEGQAAAARWARRRRASRA